MNCYFCQESLTSDDYKEDKVIKSRIGNERHCHEACFDKNIGELTELFSELPPEE